ncbi:hypothetical protein HUU40_25135 [candidate division KSB1 bacterium]|nr:hypothetical protein [candidate division KSB1 bacterium]
MESIQVELPPTLLDRIRVEASNKSLNQVVAEAIQMWLEKHKKNLRKMRGIYWKAWLARLKARKIGQRNTIIICMALPNGLTRKSHESRSFLYGYCLCLGTAQFQRSFSSRGEGAYSSGKNSAGNLVARRYSYRSCQQAGFRIMLIKQS